MHELEEWELFPDDNYDGASHMEHRGRIEHLNYLYNIENEHENEERTS